MYKQKKNKQKTNTNNGITLIALVLTIIVLLILAGVALSLALGQNGLIFKARQSKQDQQIAQEKDRIMTAYGASFAKDKGEFKVDTFRDELGKQGIALDGEIEENGKLIKFKTKHDGDGYTVDYEIDNGRIQTKQIGQNNNSGANNTIPADLKVGDIIIYDPTKDVTDNNKLKYISQKGNAQTGGNGYGDQTVTVKATNNKWVVLSTANNQIKVMAKEPIGDIPTGEYNLFAFKGGTGWLYAEEELHKACSIYGYGKGAVPTNTTYQVGNRYIGEAQTRTITNSGARSMTMEDIVKIMKGEEHTDFTYDEKKYFSYRNKYMDPSEKSTELGYPTLNTDDEDGVGLSKRKFDNDHYDIDKNNEKYDKDLVSDQKVKANKEKLKTHIFKREKPYWISYRYVSTNPYNAQFGVKIIEHYSIRGDFTFVSFIHHLKNPMSHRGHLRPVVYLDGTMLEKVSDGEWKIKD